MARFIRAVGRFLGRLFRPFRYCHIPGGNVPTPPGQTADELSQDLDLDLLPRQANRRRPPSRRRDQRGGARGSGPRRYQSELAEKNQR
jgi:hypothetical protein